MSRKKFFCIFAACLVFFSGVAFGFDEREATALSLNAPVSREIKTGERRFFTVSVQAGEAVEIVCERDGVDVGMAAFAPAGEKIAVSNAPGGFAGFDRLFFIAGKSGEYKIEVSWRRPGNLAGNFTILLKDKRGAGERDVVHAEAARLSGEAREILLGAENRYEKAVRASEKLEKALALYEKIENAQGQAETLFQIALVDGFELGKKAKAIEHFEKALAVFTKIDDQAGTAICLTYLANEIRDFDSPDKQRSFYTEKAHRYFEQALALHRKMGNKQDEAAALTSRCRLYNDTGDFQKGFESCRASLRLTGGGNPLVDFLTNVNLASLSSNSGDYDNSIKLNRAALEIYESVKDYVNPYRKAFVKSNLGNILAARGDFENGEKELREAFEITEDARWTFYSGYIQVRIAALLYQTNRLPEAQLAAEKGVEYYRQMDPVKIQGALNVLGKITLALGQTDKARALFAEAVQINRRTQDRYAEADSLYNLAQLENKAGNLETAHESIALAISISEALRAQFLGKNQRTSYLSILKKYYELEVELLIKLHEKNPSGGFAEQAWQRHERIRARSLMESLIEGGLNLNEFAPPDFYNKEQVLLEAIAAAETMRGEAAKTKNLAQQRAAEAELNKKFGEYEVLQEEIRKTNPRFSAINQPRDFAIADAQKMLDDDTAILEFALGDQQSYVWVIRKNTFRLVALPAEQSLDKCARELYAALIDRTAPDDKAIVEKSRQLSRALIAPIAEDLKNLRQIVVIADGTLQIIPFGLLTTDAEAASFEPLVAQLETIHAPSFASVVYMRENKANRQPSGEKLLAIFADPIFQQDDERFALRKPLKPKTTKPAPDNLSQALRDFGLDRLARLPFSGIEAREISSLAPDQTFLALGADASRQKFLRGDFNDYRYLHFATHGFLNQQNPELSGLVLSLYNEKREAQNGFLRVIDLYSLRLNSDLVVLSACQTALGKEIDGEGIVGLTRAFMYAGASGVVSSLWKVEDAATAELMKQFYRAMLKDNQTPSAALRTAKNEMRKIPRFSNPRFWSGFTLNGEWR